MAIDAIRSIIDQVKAYTEASRVERFAPQQAVAMDPVPSPMEEQRAEVERQAQITAEDQRQADRERRLEQNTQAQGIGQRVDRYA